MVPLHLFEIEILGNMGRKTNSIHHPLTIFSLLKAALTKGTLIAPIMKVEILLVMTRKKTIMSSDFLNHSEVKEIFILHNLKFVHHIEELIVRNPKPYLTISFGFSEVHHTPPQQPNRKQFFKHMDPANQKMDTNAKLEIHLIGYEDLTCSTNSFSMLVQYFIPQSV